MPISKDNGGLFSILVTRWQPRRPKDIKEWKTGLGSGVRVWVRFGGR